MYQSSSEGNNAAKLETNELNQEQTERREHTKAAVEKSSAGLSDKLSAIWDNCINTISDEIDQQIFSAYFKRIRFKKYDPKANAVLVTAGSKLISNYIQENYGVRIRDFLAAGCGVENLTIKMEVGYISERGDFSAAPAAASQNNPYVVVKKIITPPAASSAPDKAEGFSYGQRPNPKYTFDNFVVGSSNQFCHAAALQVADKPGESYNPLFIYGGVGLGKTHLMHAIGNAVLKKSPAKKVVYMSSETFTNTLIQSLRQGKMNEFKNNMRSIEVLLIDDIQFMRGKETTQEEFFHTFNALYSARHQIVITCDKNPAEIAGMEERLTTRFAWGLMADLQAPDFETRVAILKEKAARENFQLPEECADYIAENFASNVRELEGALTRLHAVSSLQNIPINIELANNALKSLLQPKNINISVDQIKKVVALHFGIKVSDMVSKRRNKNLAFPRHIAMYLCRKHTTYSYPEIGQAFGGRDHSSVIHAATSITNKIQASDSKKGNLKEIIETLERSLIYSN